MGNEAIEPGTPNSTWRPIQAYVLATVCLLVGLPVGYLLRGPVKSSARAAAAVANSPQPAGGMTSGKMPTLEQMKEMADKKAQPLLDKLKAEPNNAELLIQIGDIYKSTHQFKEAASYYNKSLQIEPKNVPVRTDMASCLYYVGDIDGAIAELQKSLSYDPKHAGTLLNLGVITWKGKGDVDSAVAYWEKLLKIYPNYEQKDKVKHLIEVATQDKSKTTVAEKQ
jgi:tetratricopeptide (TPR) repeat protein